MYCECKTIDEHVFGFIYDMALNDAFNRVAGLKEGDKKLVADNKEIKKIIKKYVEDVINGNAHCFYGTVDDIEKKNEKLKVECFVFGKIQKLINMTVKYSYMMFYRDSDVKKRLDECDAPMDASMIDFVFESFYYVQGINRKRGDNPGFKRDTIWSSLENNKNDTDKYRAFQNAINDIISIRNLKISRLEFDYRYWAQAKKMHAMTKKSERINFLKEVWPKIDDKLKKHDK